MFSAAMVQSLMPAFSQLQAESNSEQLNSLYSRGIRINLIWLVPVLVLLALVSKPFFTIWAGVDFGRESVLPFYILAAGLAFNILAYFPHVAIMASGRSDIFAKLYWAELFLYVFLVWVLASNFGIIGAAAAWSIRVVCDAILLFTIAKRAAGVSYSQSRNYRFLFGILIMLTPFYFNLYFQGINWIVLVSAMLALVAYCVIVWSSALEKEEIAWLANRLRVYS